MSWIPIVLASVVSVLFPPKIQNSSSSSNDVVLIKKYNDSGIFLNSSLAFFTTGLVAGVGLTLYLSAQHRYLRIREKMRSYYIRCFRSSSNEARSSSNNSNTEESKPSNGLRALSSSSVFSAANGGEKIELSASGASINILASSKSLITSTLHASQIVLPPGFQTLPSKSVSAEFYYILKGYGSFSAASGDTAFKDTKVSVGDVVLVNPLNIRSFSNKGRENLMYLRVTDCENSDAGHKNNVAVTEISKCEKIDSLLESMVEKVIDLTRWTCRVDATSVD